MCVGSAFDILSAGRPPRATFIDYPLGHTAGKPFDTEDQLGILRAALRGFETLRAPGEIRRLPNRWDDSEEWRKQDGRSDGADTRQPRDETPQFQFPADREAARASGAIG